MALLCQDRGLPCENLGFFDPVLANSVGKKLLSLRNFSQRILKLPRFDEAGSFVVIIKRLFRVEADRFIIMVDGTLKIFLLESFVTFILRDFIWFLFDLHLLLLLRSLLLWLFSFGLWPRWFLTTFLHIHSFHELLDIKVLV